jgi:oxazoline/thiazoline dehydrogenase
MPSHPFSLRFRLGVKVHPPSAERIRITLGLLSWERPVGAEARGLVEALSTPGADSTLKALSRPPFGFWTQFSLPQLEALGFLHYELMRDSRTAVILEPTERLWRPKWTALSDDSRIQASRFAFLRTEQRRCFIETPLTSVRVVFCDTRLCALWGFLANGRNLAECIAELTPAYDEGFLRSCLELLVCAGLAGVVDESGCLAEERDKTLQMWSHHELLFHARSRIGRHDLKYGAWFAYRDRIPEPAPRPSAFPSAAIALSVPPQELLASKGTNIFKLMEQRHSTRTWDEASPINLTQIGHLFYLSCRTTGTAVSSIGTDSVPYEHIYRAYPSGGSMGELEVYVVANRCSGLDCGVYHYDSYAHALHLVPGDQSWREMLLGIAQTALRSEQTPQVLLIVTARHARILWKYSSVGYSLVLKDVGVLFQTWYLLCAALGIGACAAGMGDSDLFARLTGIEYLNESSVGEFVIGAETNR